MGIAKFIVAVMLTTAAVAHADSPSSVAATQGIKPSTVSDNGGFDFGNRDSGKHAGWCKGLGHIATPGLNASGHRNHTACDVEDPSYCRKNPDDPACEN